MAAATSKELETQDIGTGDRSISLLQSRSAALIQSPDFYQHLGLSEIGVPKNGWYIMENLKIKWMI